MDGTGVPGKLRLSARTARERPFSQSTAIHARTIPLREATAGRTAQNSYPHEGGKEVEKQSRAPVPSRVAFRGSPPRGVRIRTRRCCKS